MKKSKVKLDSAAIQKFFVHHVEKIVLVVVVGVMAWLVYAGYSLPGLESGKTPSGLKTVSNQTRTFIDDPQRWTTVAPERVVSEDLVALVGDSQKDTDPSRYFLPQPLSPPNFPKLSPRLDPTLYPPQNLEVEPVIGPLASYPASMEELDPLYEAPPSEPEEKKPPRKPNPRTTARGGPMGDPYGGMLGGETGSADGMSSPGPGGPGARGRRGRSRGRSGSGSSSQFSGGGTPPPGSASAAGGSAMMGLSGGMTPGGEGGYGSYGMGGMAAGLNPESVRGFQTSDQYAIGRHTGAMVIKAVVPFEKQAEEFLNSLGNSLDYDAQRDQPWYLGFWVERAEVSADDLGADPATLPWVQLKVKATLEEQIGSATRPPTWAGALTEIVDPNYLDTELTHPAPPFMQREVWNLLTHADVPLATQAMTGYGGDGMMFPGAQPKEGADKPETPSDLPTLGPGSGIPGAYDGGYSGSADSGSTGYGPRGPGGPGGMRMPGGPGGMMSGGSGGMMSGGSRMPFGGGSGMSTYGGGSMGGYADGGYGGYGAGAEIAPPKYKLIRFTDTKVEEGKHYRYRVKVLLHDPNHPTASMVSPLLGSLDQKVRDRVLALDAADAAKPKYPDGTPYRTFWIESPWSEPSEVVTLPSTSEYYVGTVEPPPSVEIVPGKPKVPSSQPKAKVLTSVWDPVKVVDVPTEVDVFRGSILNFVKDAEVIHPVTKEVVALEKYSFKTDAIIADLGGGELIPPVDKKNDEPLAAPGEMLVFDHAGNLHVQEETGDVEGFRRLLLPKQDETAPVPGADGQYPDGAAAGSPDSGYEEMMLGPGGGGRGPGRGRSRGGTSRGGP